MSRTLLPPVVWELIAVCGKILSQLRHAWEFQGPCAQYVSYVILKEDGRGPCPKPLFIPSSLVATTNMTPNSQQALWLTTRQGAFAVQPTPVYKPGPGEILVRVEASALNPVDWKIQSYGIFIEEYPAILGVDLAGVVEEVGEDVKDLKRGDRV